MGEIKIGVKTPTRPCWVDGRKGLFHRYIDKTETVFITECNMTPVGVEAAKEYFDNTKIIPNGFRVDKIVTTYALIEFEDGHMEEIPPTTITFLSDSDFEEIYWGDEKIIEKDMLANCNNCLHSFKDIGRKPCNECFGIVSHPKWESRK